MIYIEGIPAQEYCMWFEVFRCRMGMDGIRTHTLFYIFICKKRETTFTICQNISFCHRREYMLVYMEICVRMSNRRYMQYGLGLIQFLVGNRQFNKSTNS